MWGSAAEKKSMLAGGGKKEEEEPGEMVVCHLAMEEGGGQASQGGKGANACFLFGRGKIAERKRKGRKDRDGWWE